jgi:hypothetical protein
VPLVGLETAPKNLEKQGFHAQRGTDSGTPADAGQVEALAAELMKLSAADRGRLAALILGKANNS